MKSLRLDLPKAKDFRMYVTKAGDRTLTPAEKRKLKEKRNFRCDKCHKKFNSRYLEIHHKQGVGQVKNLNKFSTPTFSMGKKHIPKYDRQKSNLQVLCLICHDGTKKNKKKKTRNVRKKNNYEFSIPKIKLPKF